MHNNCLYQQGEVVLKAEISQQHHAGEWHTPPSRSRWVGDGVWRTRVDPPLHMSDPVHMYTYFMYVCFYGHIVKIKIIHNSPRH